MTREITRRTSVRNSQHVLIGVLAGLILFVLLGQFVENKDFEEAALNQQTKSLFSTVNGRPIHCNDMRTIPACVQSYKDRSKNPIILWLGNSQLHAVNQLKEGQQTSALRLHRAMKAHDQYVTVWSQPNANLQEHYIIFNWAKERLPVKTLILPLVFDDLRETGIRDNLKSALLDQSTREIIGRSEIGRKLIQDAIAKTQTIDNETTQARVEEWLNEKIEAAFTPWRQRAKLRSDIFLQLFYFRNWIFNIKSSDVRRIIPATRSSNMQALEALLMDARSHNIKVLLYIAPIRDDVSLPYNLNEYETFKQDASRLSRTYGVNLLNLENLVPGDKWGLTDSTTTDQAEIDFMHFQADGHILLADEIFSKLKGDSAR